MSEPTTSTSSGNSGKGIERVQLKEHIVEIVSDSGEGAQKAGQAFAAISAKMGNGVWTVEIIPAEIKPPARSRAGASGIRIRIGSEYITNMGDQADLVIAFNEQVLYGRIEQRAFKKGTIILIENKWADDPSTAIREQYASTVAMLRESGYIVKELALERACLKYTANPRLGKNMFVLGMLTHIYDRDLDTALNEVNVLFGRKGQKVVESNQTLLRAGYEFAQENLDLAYTIPPWDNDKPLVVMNGNVATGLGIMASGMEIIAMYPITPATSVSHYLAGSFYKTGGFVHQAEDEISAIGFAIGASYAGKTACTVSSGPGLALKTEFLGLAVMAEIPLVIVIVQRGGPSTGLPTKVEQGDLLASLYGAAGDAPKVILAPATIEECYHFVITARKLAETYRGPVIVLTDANLATGVQPFVRPEVTPDTFAPPIDQSSWDEKVRPYEWDPETGFSPRPIPGQAGGEYVLTGLAHTEESHVAYDPDSNQRGAEMRSLKLATLQKTLKTPEILGEEEGDLLIVGWGSTYGAIQEGVKRAQAEGHKVSAIHLRFLSPLPLGLKDLFSKFKKVMTIEINYSDPADSPLIPEEGRRRAQLATVLRSVTLLDIDSWSNVYGQPMQPSAIYNEIVRRLS